MLSPLEQIWLRSGLRDHIISYDETREWPKEERERIFALGILRRREDAEGIDCDACGESHSEEVVFLDEDAPDGLIPCPLVGVVRVRRERLQQWEVDFTAMAKLLKAAFELAGAVQELKPGRVWLVGNRRLGGRAAEFFLIQGADWRDGAEVLASTPRLENSPAPVILFPWGLPKDPAWQSNGRALYSLHELVSLGESGLVVSVKVFEDLYRQIAERREREIVPTAVEKRNALVEQVLTSYNCRVKDIYTWAGVVREDFYRWKRGDPKVPNGGDKANRIERLLQFGQKTRP